MCRNIKTLFNFDPPATEEEIRSASLQFVRKISGFQEPSKANAEAFRLAVDEVAAIAGKLMDSLVTQAEPRSREVELEKARARSAKRFGTGEDTAKLNSAAALDSVHVPESDRDGR
ncbi:MULTISPECIES: DUF2277 domain-containing protein [Paenibacillus]|uniref:DUF2277 domain-containing protein n=1 Tax=Paenibacillus TaxID=44249 RepID=UPI0022B88474|nr:DUF2277 domain-containing protein [Paenibacillus caseinilyticus]MCZ8520291.1 DUF2277 domain-containing protein [Paenibacillus caseinilyticus]